jgi:hypothetical protein
MKFRFLVAMSAVSSLVVSAAFGQGRDYRAERLVLDDNNGNTLIIQTPAGPITGGTLTLPDPAGAGTFLISSPAGGSQSVAGDFLPDTDNSYDLGSGAMRWQDVFAAGDVSVGDEVQFVETGGGTDYVGFQAPAAVTTNQIWTLPAADGTSGQALVTDGAGALSWATAGGLSTVTHNATLSGNGTVGSPLGINLGNANTWTANQTFASTFLITSNARIAMTNSDNNGRDLRIQEPSGTGTQYIGIRCGNVTNNGNYVWPTAIGSAGQVLTIATSNFGGFNDSATLSWTTVSGGAASVDSTLIGDGTGGSPLGIDLAQSNVWTSTITTFAGFLESRNEPFVVTNTDNSANEIRIQEASGNGSNYMAFRADTSISTNDVWIMPSTAGTAGEALTITAVNTPSNRFYTLDWEAPTAPAQYDYLNVTGSTTLTSSNEIVGVNTSGGAYTVTLPAANSVPAGKFYVINVEVAGNNVTIARSGTDTIDGATSINLTASLLQGRLIYSNGTNAWFTGI